MRLEWTKRALADLARFRRFLETDYPKLSLEIAEALRTKAGILADFPDLGTVLPRRRTDRQYVVEALAARYVIQYRRSHTRVLILRVFHSKESRRT